MSLLVAYDDSGSEDDCLSPSQEEGDTASIQTRTCGNSSLEVAHSPNSSKAEEGILKLEYYGHHSEGPQPRPWPQGLENRLTVVPPPSSLAAAPGKISPKWTPCEMPQMVNDKLNQAKRPSAVPSGIRPYIPKRQRLATSGETLNSKSQMEHDPGCQTRISPILSEVSERVKPYLDNRPAAAGIPRRLLLSLGGHQGPVNTVQWCPVPQHSHLLLSASMDKTFKVWDAVESGRCLRVYTCHRGAVRDACWTPCGRRLLTGAFDDQCALTDVETGQALVTCDSQFRVMCVAVHPSSPEVFLCGGYSSAVKAWDSRCCKVVNVYKADIQQTLDILFLGGGSDFITSSDCVSRDSADRTLIAWDFQTTARVSNQIYQERYTCPSLALHPLDDCFVAQTNGNYVAVFSSQRPYRMNKRRRYEGHKVGGNSRLDDTLCDIILGKSSEVEGYAVRCQFSADGSILASGSSSGSAHFYDYNNARPLHGLRAHREACLCVSQHPLLPATAATCDWAGEIKVWH